MDSELENEVTEMEGFGQFIEDRGFEKGMIKGKADSIKALMEKENVRKLL